MDESSNNENLKSFDDNSDSLKEFVNILKLKETELNSLRQENDKLKNRIILFEINCEKLIVDLYVFTDKIEKKGSENVGEEFYNIERDEHSNKIFKCFTKNIHKLQDKIETQSATIENLIEENKWFTMKIIHFTKILNKVKRVNMCVNDFLSNPTKFQNSKKTQLDDLIKNNDDVSIGCSSLISLDSIDIKNRYVRNKNVSNNYSSYICQLCLKAFSDFTSLQKHYFTCGGTP